jgi:hypothetical protein
MKNKRKKREKKKIDCIDKVFIFRVISSKGIVDHKAMNLRMMCDTKRWRTFLFTVKRSSLQPKKPLDK